MTKPRFLSGKNRLNLFLIFALAISSLFAYIIPKSVSLNSNSIIEEEVIFASHPLTGISDNIVICSDDGSEVHEIYLCGATDDRILNANISNYKQIIWSKFQEGSCTDAQPNCPNTSPTCSWTQLNTTSQYTVTDSGEYRIYVQYNDNSIVRYYFNVYSNGLDPNAVATDIDCNGPGSITINNAPSTYEFSINNGASWQDSNVFTITSANTYDIQLRRKDNVGGCLFEVDDITVNNISIDATATLIPITCTGEKGGIKIDINETSLTYIYEISEGGNLINSSGPLSSNTYTFNNLDAGTYDVEVRFSNSIGCTWTTTETLNPFNAVQPNAVATKNIDCTDGIISVTHSGGTAPYEYSLNGSATYSSFTSGNQTDIPVNTAGSYTITVKDANGCEIDSTPIDIIAEAEIAYTLNSKDVSCNGANDGSLKVDVSDDQGYNLTYSLNGGSFQTSSVFSNLNPGNYTITIRKTKPGSTCTLTTASQVIAEPITLSATAAVTTPIDCDNTTATISVTGTSGGTAPYKYSLNGTTFQTNTAFAGLGFGDYTVTIADQNNCKVTVPLTVDASAHPSNLLFAIDNVNCTTKATDIAVTVENGTGPFTYRIVSPIPTTASSNNVFTGLIPNLVYKFEVVTADNCTIVRDYVVPQPMQFSTFASVKENVSCSTATDGVIEVSVNDFQTSYDVVIEDGSGNITPFGVTNITSSPITISNLPADTYTIKIADESGPCPKIQTATVEQPTSPLSIASFDVVHVLCGKPGSVKINATGGWGSYKYQVRRPDNSLFPATAQTNKTITGLTQFGLYTIIVTDINGCVEDSQTFTIEDRQGPVAEVDQSASEYCYTTATKSSLKIDILSGYPPYVYTINNGPKQTVTGTSFTLSNLTPKKYVVKIIDSNLCSTIVADTEIRPQLFSVGTVTKPLGCGSAPADRATLTAKSTGGYGTSTFEVRMDGGAWSSVTFPYYTDVVGSYEFRATDQKGCTAISQPVNVVVPPAIGSNNKITPTACGSNNNGSVVVKGTGGTPPFLYSFDGSPFTTKTLYNKLDAIDYVLVIRDKLNCEFTETVTIGALPSISATAIKTADISCNPGTGDSPGIIEVSNVQDAVGLVRVRLNGGDGTTSGTPPWVYQNVGGIDMSNPATVHTININNHGTYHVTVEDERGCIWKSDPITITRPPIPHGVTQPVGMQTCANGATFDFTVNPDPGLVGPFKMRMWPGSPDDPFGGAWRDFDAATNPSYDALDPANERDYRVSGLLFGVNYDIIVLDMNTQCTYVADLGMVIAPDPPDDKFKAFSTVQSYACANSTGGTARIRVEAAGDANTFGIGGPDGIQSVSWKTYNASGSSNAAYMHSGTANDSGSGGDIIFDIPNVISGWYVVEVQNESGCTIGHRFNIYAPPVELKNRLQDYSPPNCNIGAQIAVEAKGGWNDKDSYQASNTIDPTWREYEYAYVLASISDPTTIPASEWTTDDYKEITPSAYDGVNNVYQVWVRDAAGCVDELDTPITIIRDLDPVLDSVVVNNRCNTPNELYNTTINISGGTGTIYYTWDGEVTTSNTKDLTPGEHTVQVTDENGCATLSEDLLIYPQMQTSASVTQIEPCDPPNSGEVLVEVYGGSGDYTIEQISPAGPTNTTGIFTGLTHSINYEFRVHDNLSGCADQTVTAYIDEPLIPKFRTVTPVQQVTCNGDDNGKIIVEPEPGQSNLDVLYDYSINGAPYQASNVFDNLAPGTYTISVHSAKNCIQTLPPVTITEPTPLVLDTPTATPFACTADNSYGTGILSVSVNGTGTGPYNYSYNGSGFSSSDTFEFLYTSSPQTIVIDVVDTNGCTDQTSIVIPAAEKVEASVNEIQAMNCDDDAIIEIVGTPAAVNPTDYEVRELISGNLINGTGQGQITIPAGNPGYYIYELLDTTTGCASIITYSIAPFDFIGVSATKLEDVHCYGDADGAIEFTLSGYSGAFDFEIFDTTNPGTAFITGSGNTSTPVSTVNTLPVGTYFVRVKATDIPLCEAESNHITIQSPESALDFSYEITNLLSCVPGNDSEVTATPVGGWSGYEFELVDPANPGTPIQSFGPNNVFSGLTSGINYELTLRDSGGCDNVMQVITIPTIDAIILTETSTNPTCPGAANGSITVTASREFGNGHT
ncbi:hypothetical protein, partial [Aurantibacter sp.]|uniref:hypothetical protein n=1 Tax=Aurantibacter sp. TaxID=2807103 RepID=UPI0032633294